MSWHEDQPIVEEGFTTQALANTVQVWLPITFSTQTTHPIAEGKLYVQLNDVQRTLLSNSNEALVNATYTLTETNRAQIEGMLNEISDFDIAFFRAVIGAATKLLLPSGWVASAATQAVKTLVGFLLSQPDSKETAAYLAANLAVGGTLRELWNTVSIAPGQAYFFRNIQYEVNIGAETRQFVILSTRYSLAP